MIFDLFGLKLSLVMPYTGLWVLILLIVLVIGSYMLMVRIRRERVIKLGNFYTLKKVQGFRVAIPHPYLLIAKIIIVTLLFLVATDSIQINLVKPVTDTDFVIALDTSQTMLMPDYNPNRLGAAKMESIQWLNKLPAISEIGVIQFSDNAVPVVQPTTDFNKVVRGIKSVSVNLNTSGTAMGDAIILADSMLSKSSRQKVLVIITDGQSNVGVNVYDAADKVKRDGIKIYAIGIGDNAQTTKFIQEFKKLISEKGYNISNMDIASSDLNMTMLNEITSKTGGKAFSISNTVDFEDAFKSIVTKNEAVSLNSVYYILLFIVALELVETVIFAKFGAL